jgi:menaquinone-specific isochorismate synthase
MTRIRVRPLNGPIPYLDRRPSLVWRSPTIELAGWGEALRIDCGTGADRFNAGRRMLDRWWDAAEIDGEAQDSTQLPVAFGSFTFDERSPGSVMLVPEVLVAGDRDGWRVVTVGGASLDSHPALRLTPSTDRPRFAGSSVPDMMWMEAVAEAIALIDAGELVKVVLARDYALWSKSPFDRHRVLSTLIERFPQCFNFLISDLVGASPELLISRHGNEVESMPLAGSAPRGQDPEEDDLIGKSLLTSDKELREHREAAASVGRVLGEVCSKLSRPATPELLRLANVQHLATRFTGTLSTPMSVIDLVDRLHPTAAVGGTPTEKAVELIRRLEGMERGRYTGPVGWTNAAGDGEWAIALRCAELSGARARLFAGSGIVAGSLPESELEETRLKLTTMMNALES